MVLISFSRLSFAAAVPRGAGSHLPIVLHRKHEIGQLQMITQDGFKECKIPSFVKAKSKKVRLGAVSGVSLFCGECTPSQKKKTGAGCKNGCSCHLTGVCTCAACSCGPDCPCKRSAAGNGSGAGNVNCGCTPLSKCSIHQ